MRHVWKGINSNSTSIKDNDALIKLRKDLKDAIEKARSLENDNEEKEIFSSRTLAEIESLKQNKEALENRIKRKRKDLSQWWLATGQAAPYPPLVVFMYCRFCGPVFICIFANENCESFIIIIIKQWLHIYAYWVEQR